MKLRSSPVSSTTGSANAARKSASSAPPKVTKVASWPVRSLPSAASPLAVGASEESSPQPDPITRQMAKAGSHESL